MSALSINQLNCTYEGKTVLSHLSLEVQENEILCLLGSSGCGKTTLLKAIAGLLPVDFGSVSLSGRLLSDAKQHIPPEKRNIGMIFQDYALFPHLSVAENVAFGLQGKSRQQMSEIVADMLNRVQLQGLESRYPHELSGGQQQRVAIARALACQPALLLLDEPFSNIDAQVRSELIQDIRQLLKERGVTAIFVTHSKEEAFAFADRLAVMHEGVIAQIGTALTLYQQPANRFVADFLGHSNYLPITPHTTTQFRSLLGDFDYAVNPDATYTMQPDRNYEWLLRPEQIQLQIDPLGAGEILTQQFLGTLHRYQIRLDHQLLQVHSTEYFPVGARINVQTSGKTPVLFPVP